MRATAEGSEAGNLIVINKYGLTTRDVISHARQFDFLKSKLLEHSHTYTNLPQGFSMDLFEQVVGTPQVYHLDSENEIEVLVQ